MELAKDLRIEYLRPWKLFSLAVGVALLIGGAYHYDAPDWDIPISLIMASCAYLTAPWSIRVIVERQWRNVPLMLLFTWFSVDGCYAIYWYFRDPHALAVMRDANFLASQTLYGMCGLIWYYRGTLKQFWTDATSSLLARDRKVEGITNAGDHPLGLSHSTKNSSNYRASPGGIQNGK